MEHADTAQLAAVCAAIGSVLVLLAGGRTALLAGLVVLAASEAALALALGTGPLGELLSPAGAAAAALGLVALCAAAALLARRPALAPLAILIAAPLRPPLEFGASDRFLVSVADDGQLGRLVPLYFVLAAAALALGWRVLRGAEPRPLPRALALPAAAFFALAFVSLLWARDVEAGTNLLVFFILPFVVLLATVARAPYPDWLPRALAIAALALAALFAVVGLWQAATQELLFYAPNLAVSNANTDYFRVTSLFGDPSLYGRHLVLGLCVVLALLVARRGNRWLMIGVLALLWAGLFFSYSQSSMVALVLVTLALAVATGDRGIRRAVAALAVVVIVGAAGYATLRLVDGQSLNDITSDRTNRVEYALRVIEEHPLAGVGIGGQPRVSRQLARSDRPTPLFVSHTTPLTVAADLGAIGLVLYLCLLAGGGWVVAAVFRRDGALALALGAAFLALFAHALFYSGFLEDPITWLVLGIGAGWLTWREGLEPATAAGRSARRTAKPAAAA